MTLQTVDEQIKLLIGDLIIKNMQLAARVRELEAQLSPQKPADPPAPKAAS